MGTFLHPTYLLSILIALAVHEWAHAFAADRLGDPTPKMSGRLTLNPVAHLDLLGSILFLTVGFGWGKPVPIDPRYFKHWKRDTAITAIAGPLSNLVLAFLAFGFLLLLSPGVTAESAWGLLDVSTGGSVATAFLVQFLGSSLFINLGLMAFNLLPIAPLDGSKVLAPFIPLRYEHLYEDFMRRGPIILLVLFLGEQLLQFPFLSLWIGWIMDAVLGVMMSAVTSL